MSHTPIPSLSDAADTRRRELPASLALMLLTGGLAAAIMGGGAPVAWAAIMSVLLICDTELYRRLDAAERELNARTIGLLAAWAFFYSAFYAVLPIALWLDGQAAGAAAAMVLWVAGVVRHFSRGVSGALPVALAGAAPPALALLVSPLMIAAMGAQPDWNVAIIAAVGGGALMAYVTFARLSASDAERALREAKEKQGLSESLALLMFEAGEVVAVMVDVNGRVVTMSRAMRAIIGADAVGKLFTDVCPWSGARWRESFSRALSGQTVRVEEDRVGEGETARWYRWLASPWRSENGEIGGAVAYGGEITDLVSARNAAAANDERLRVALAADRSVIWEFDASNRKLSWCGDPKPIYGELAPQEASVEAFTQLSPDEGAQVCEAAREATAHGGSFEHKMRGPDGGDLWLQVSSYAFTDPGTGAQKVVGLSKDITARKRDEERFLAAMDRAEAALRAKRAMLMQAGAEPVEAPPPPADGIGVSEMFERLEALQEEMSARDGLLAETLESLRATREAAEAASMSKSNFLASMSHELRTPLNAIIGYSEMLSEEAEAEGRTHDVADIQRVLHSARQLLHLINGILDLSKIEAGRMDIAPADFDVARLVEEAVETVGPSAEKNCNTVETEIAADVGAAHSDAFKLNQCLLNLLSNAMKFTRGGRVGVKVWRDEREGQDWLHIAVSDTGVGLSQEQQARLFEAFMQADASTSRVYGGTGLGLAITRRIMRLLGGDISVQSAPGEGSTFTLSLPAQAAGRVEREAAPALDEGAQRLVLVIEDEATARDLTERALSRLGFAVRGAPTGGEGLALARALKPSLIVLDINLPDMSGWDVMAALREDCADIPVIIHSIDDERTRARSAGACELLVKPADRDVLAAAVLRFARTPEPPASAQPTLSQTFAKTA